MATGNSNREFSESTQLVGHVEIFQDRDWLGDPRMAAFTVYVDGSRFGKLALKSTIRFTLPEGVHRLRIRQFYFMSPTVTINVVSGQILRLKADIPRVPLMARILKMLRLTRALDLSVVEGAGGTDPDFAGTRLPSQRGLWISVLLQIFGFTLLVLSISHKSWLLAIPSVILIAAGMAKALTAVRIHKQGSAKPN
jgi:hypothetical protein